MCPPQSCLCTDGFVLGPNNRTMAAMMSETFRPPTLLPGGPPAVLPHVSSARSHESVVSISGSTNALFSARHTPHCALSCAFNYSCVIICIIELSGNSSHHKHFVYFRFALSLRSLFLLRGGSGVCCLTDSCGNFCVSRFVRQSKIYAKKALFCLAACFTTS